MQEIYKVKNKEESLDETMIKATCDTFIQTLDELMDLADQQYNIYGIDRSIRRVSYCFAQLLAIAIFSP